MPESAKISKNGKIYLITLGGLWLYWINTMASHNLWRLVLDFWPMGLTMALGSFVAGSTPAGGAAVAFPVFTKALNVDSGDARTFGLMIQSVGMTMASLFIVTRGIPVEWRVIRWGGGAGVLGLILGSLIIPDLDDYPRIVFTSITTSLGVTLVVIHWFLKQIHDSKDLLWGWRQRLHFAGIGMVGGVVSSLTGSGVDMSLYIIMTLGYGVAERLAVPTTVVCMALVSIAGFYLHQQVLEDIRPVVWGYWTVCSPIVAVGAPMGAWVVSKISRDLLIQFIILLALVDLVSTLWLIDFDWIRFSVMCVTFAVSGLWIKSLLNWRKRRSGEI